MENSDAPGIRGEPGGHRAFRRGRDSPDANFPFADEPREREPRDREFRDRGLRR